jgi:hypothetical protein
MSIEALEAFFDKAKAFCVKVAQERDEERAKNTDLEALLKVTEEERDRERRDRLKVVEDYSQLEDRARRLERDNAVMHSRSEDILRIIKADGERIADSSDLKPDQILHPRPVADDQLEKDFEKIGKQLSESRLPHPALGDSYVSVRNDLKENAQAHVEQVK